MSDFRRKSFVRGRGYVDQRRWTRHFTASGTDGFRNKRVLNKKMRKAKEELSNWIVLFSFTFAIIIQKVKFKKECGKIYGKR